MAPWRIAISTRDPACESIQCLSGTAKIGVALCIVFVTIGGAFTYYWAHIRGRTDKHDTVSQNEDEDGVVFRLEISHIHHHTIDQGRDAVVRPAPKASDSPAAANPHDLVTQIEIPASHRVLPSSSVLPPAYGIYKHPILVPDLVDLVVPGPPTPSSALPIPAPDATAGDHPKYLELHPWQGDQQYSPTEPSPGYAATITSEFSSDRGRTRPPVTHHARRQSPDRKTGSRSSNPPHQVRPPKDSPSRIPSATTLGTESRAGLEELLTRRIVSDSLDTTVAEYLARRHISGSNSTGHTVKHSGRGPVVLSASRRNVLDIHTRADESHIGRPTVQRVQSPRLATQRDVNKLLAVGESRIGRQRRHYSRGRRARSPRRASVSCTSESSHQGDQDDRGRRTARGDRSGPPRARSVLHHIFPVGDTYIGGKDRDQLRSRSRRSRSERRHESRSRRAQSSGRESSSLSSEDSNSDVFRRGRRSFRDERREPPRTRSVFRHFFQGGESRLGQGGRDQRRSQDHQTPVRHSQSQCLPPSRPQSASQHQSTSTRQSASQRQSPSDHQSQNHGCGPLQATSNPRPQHASSAESGASTTGAMCSFGGSFQSTRSSPPASPTALQDRGPATAPHHNREGNAD